MTEIVSVYAVFANEEEAARIGRRMVEEKLAACVNIIGNCRSIYRWEGEVQDAEEVAAIFKTAQSSARNLIERISELHSYEVPGLAVWSITETLDPYRAWVLTNSTH